MFAETREMCKLHILTYVCILQIIDQYCKRRRLLLNEMSSEDNFELCVLLHVTTLCRPQKYTVSFCNPHTSVSQM